MSRKHVIVIGVLVVLTAAVLRLAFLSSVPPGLHYDEATNGIIVRGIAFEGQRPLFIQSFTGKETLWFYLAALVVRIAGPSVFSLRLASAMIGIVTVALSGWMVYHFYPEDSRHYELILLTMAVLATSFWHGVIGRLAFRAISQPLLQAAALGFLWGGLHSPAGSRRRLLWMALAGGATGLAGYTYLAVRLFPIPLAIALLILLVSDTERARLLPGLAAFGAGALLVFAPLGIFFLHHPQAFTTRIDQVAPASLAEALEGGRLALQMFFLAGDPLWRFNLPGKPIYGPVLGGLFLFGYGIAIRDTFRAKRAPDRALGALLITWPIATLVPTALAVGEITPSNLRAIGLAPVIALYPALGITEITGWLRSKTEFLGQLGRYSFSAALVLILAVNGGLMLRDTLRWGGTTALYFDNDAHVAAVADYLNNASLPPDTRPYVATQHFRHPTIAFLTEQYDNSRSLFGGDGLALAPTGSTLAIYTRDVPPPEDWVNRLEPYQVDTALGSDGGPDFLAYLLPDNFDMGWNPVTPANFANIIEIQEAVAYPAKSGKEAVIDLGWRILSPADQPDYAFVAEVCDAWGWCWVKAGLDGSLERGQNNVYSSTQWEPGERLYTQIAIPLPQGIPPGEYTAHVSLFSAAADARLPLLDEAGSFAGQYAPVEGITITANQSPSLDTLPVQRHLDAETGSGVTLLGYDISGQAVPAGAQIDLALYWVNNNSQPADYPVRLMLGDEIVFEGDPVHGAYPTSAWAPGELVIDRYKLRIPRDHPAGSYTLSVQLGDSSPVELGMLAVEDTDRRFDLPAGISLIDPQAVYGERIMLAGYEVSQAQISPGKELDLTLVWQAVEQMDIGYTVFVHLFDREGRILVQQDRPPQTETGSYPTDLWVSGEIVTDTYRLTIPMDAPSGEYRIRVGLYRPESGQRLSLPGWPDDAYLLPLTILIQ